MLAFIPNADGGTSFATSDKAELAPKRPTVVAVEPAYKETRAYRFDQRFIPLDDGRTLLRLIHPLRLKPDKATGTFEVVGWGITLPISQAEELPRQIARRFLTLFSKANTQTITESEKKEWLLICDQVDVSHFSIDRSAPHYMEGTLRRKFPVTVEWHDGTTEHLGTRMSANFFPLEAGDNFSAFVKVGRNNETLSIDRISILGA